MRAFATHVRFALRTLRRAPGFTAIAILCLAIGIGAITTMAETVDLLLFRPPSQVRAAKEIVQLHFDFVIPGATHHMTSMLSQGTGYADYVSVRDSLHGLHSVAGYHTATLSLGRGTAARPVVVGFVTGSFFPLLGVIPAIGELIGTDAAGMNGAAAPVVISHALWTAQFGGDSAIIGRHIALGKGTYTVVGVTPTGFRGVELLHPMDVWLPIGAAQQELYDGNHQLFLSYSEGLVQVIGRMSPDVSPQRVTAQAAALLQAGYVSRLGSRFGDTKTVATLTPIIPGLRGQRTTDVSVALWLTGVASIVLLIACANVAGLLLVRATDRRREVAIRLALGATRGQLAQLFLIEGLILAVLGGVLGILFRQWGGAVIRTFLLPQLGIAHGVFDGRILALSALVTLVTGLGCGFVPALHTWRRDIAGAVIGAPRTGRVPQARVRAALLVGQVALAMTLVAGAALFISSWWNVRAIQLGFSPDRVLVGQMDLGQIGYTRAETRAAYDRVLERVRAVPGVQDVSLASYVPFLDWFDVPVVIPGIDPDRVRDASRYSRGPQLNVISPSFFKTTGTALRSGRAFTIADHAGTEAVAIINEKMARTFWPSGNALGQCIQIKKLGRSGGDVPCSRIVGIAADTRTTGLRDAPDLQVYAPLAQRIDVAPGYLVVRTDGRPAALVAAVRHAMQGATSGLPFADVKPMTAYLEPEMRPWRLGASMFTLFGAMALGLAAVGLYGVFSYAVARRTREMGIRGALGARSQDIVRLVIRDGLRLSTVGVVVGAALAIGVGRVLAALLVGVTGTIPVLLALSALLVLGITVLAVGLPARRAARIDPAVALREE